MLTARALEPQQGRTLSALFNRDCACITLDRAAFEAALRLEADDPALADALLATRPHLASNAAAFLARADHDAMLATMSAAEAAARLPAWRAETLRSDVAAADFGTAGAFMGYDFHIAPDGPKLIEINTNAGGAFINALIRRAQIACCEEVAAALADPQTDDFERRAFAMFAEEWRRQRGGGLPRRVAIVDDAPTSQYLYPEFMLARRLFEAHGVEALIVDPTDLVFDGSALSARGAPVDLVYNRLVDFDLSQPAHAALRNAYLAGAAVVTPGPRHHALYADKRNLVRLSDAARLRDWGLDEAHLSTLSGLPRAVPVDAANADALWTERKRWFFKPAGGYGARAVYRGDKLTRSVWAHIAGDGGYIAQEIAPPGERRVKVDGAARMLKADIRLFAYDGAPLLLAARLYQGQTTNFRTAGGGFAPVFIV